MSLSLTSNKELVATTELDDVFYAGGVTNEGNNRR